MGLHNVYTAEQEDFLRSHYEGISRKELANLFNARFGTSKSWKTIASWCNTRGLKSGLDGRYKNGHDQWNKGMSGEEYLSHFTKPLVIPDNRIYHIGDEVYRHGKWYVVISEEPNVEFCNRLQLKARYIWEKEIGPLTDDEMVIHLNRDENDFSLDNLYVVPTKYRALMWKHNKWYSNDRELTLAGIKWCELFYAMKEIKK